MTRKEIKGGAEPLRLLSDISSVAASMVSATTPTANWPTGVFPFVVRVRDTTGVVEEKMLVSSRAGTGFTILTRGYDGTLPVGHTAGEAIEHVADADTISETNAHVNDSTRDDHSQYLNTARHDVSARHTFGAAFPNPSVPTPIATAASVGSGTGPPRDDHAHALPDGIVVAGKLGTGAVVAGNLAVASIDLPSRFVAGVVDAAAIADGTVGTAELATNAVTTVKITDANVTTAKIADANVTLPKISLGADATLATDPIRKSQLDAKFPTALSTYVPVLTQNGSGVAVTVNYAKYIVNNGICAVWVAITATANSAAGTGGVVCTIPVANAFGGSLAVSVGGGRVLRAGVDTLYETFTGSPATVVAFDSSTLLTIPQIAIGDIFTFLCNYPV